MGKRCVFRDLSGVLRGYLVQEDGCVRCRIPPMQDAELVMLHENRQAARYRIENNDGECLFPPCEEEITGGYVVAGGELILASNEKVRCIWNVRESAKHHQKKDIALRLQQKETEERNKTEAAIKTHAESDRNSCERSVPERRWPPPPCMPGARCIRGRWIAAGQETMEKI